MLKKFWVTLILAGAIFCTGCARFPSGTNNATGRELIVSMSVEGQIDTSSYHFFVVNVNPSSNSNNNTMGPLPVIAFPWGNGFVGGSATGFVEYNGSLPGAGFLVYNFIPNDNLQGLSQPVAPYQDYPVTNDTSSLSFTVPLSDFATTAVPLSEIETLQVNFIATNSLPINTENQYLSNPKYVDALGLPSSNISFASISNSDGNYSGGPFDETVETGTGSITPVDQPNFHITAWSIRISG